MSNYQYDAAFLNFKCVACDGLGQNMVACVSNGGLYMSYDFGNTWILNANENVQIQNWKYVVCSENGCQTLAACVSNGGLYMSYDAGYTWIYNLQPETQFRYWQCMACTYYADIIIACEENGSIFISYDYGQTWSYSYDTTKKWTSVSCTYDASIIVACEYDGYIYNSTDYGSSWNITYNIANKWVCIDISRYWGYGDYVQSVYACAYDGGIYKLDDFNNNWYLSYNTNKKWTSIKAYDNNMVDNFVYATVDDMNTSNATNGIYISTNSGVSWTLNPSSMSKSKNWEFITASANGERIIAITNNNYSNIDNGIYVSGNYANDWSKYTNYFKTFSLNFSSIASNSSGNIIAACVYGGGLYISNGVDSSFNIVSDINTLNKKWSCITSNSTGNGLVAVINDSSNNGTNGIYTSSNYGATWTLNSDSSTKGKQWSSVASNSTGDRLVAVINDSSNNGTNGIYTSSNYGAAWTLNSDSSTKGKQWSSVTSNSNGDRLVAVINNNIDDGTNGIYTSSDYGDTWTLNSDSSTKGKQWSSVTSNSTGDRLVAVINDSSNNGTNGIYTSSNYGATWTLNSDSSTKGKQWSSVTSNSNGDRLVAVINNNIDDGTNGIYTSSDYGDTWTLNLSDYTVGKQWKSVSCNTNGDIIITVAEYYYTYISTNYNELWYPLQNTETNPKPYIPKTWYSVSFLDENNNNNSIFNGYFSVNNPTNLIENFYDYNDIGNNILVEPGGVFYKFPIKNFSRTGFTISFFSYLNIFNEIDINIWYIGSADEYGGDWALTKSVQVFGVRDSIVISNYYTVNFTELIEPPSYDITTYYYASFMDISNNIIFSGYFSVNNTNNMHRITDFYNMDGVNLFKNNGFNNQDNLFYKIPVMNFSRGGINIISYNGINIPRINNAIYYSIYSILDTNVPLNNKVKISGLDRNGNIISTSDILTVSFNTVVSIPSPPPRPPSPPPPPPPPVIINENHSKLNPYNILKYCTAECQKAETQKNLKKFNTSTNSTQQSKAMRCSQYIRQNSANTINNNNA